MVSPRPCPGGSVGELVSAVIAGRTIPTLRAGLDPLLQWLAAPDAPQAAGIDAAFRERSLDRRPARRLALMLLEEALFSGSDDPNRVLGLDGDAEGEALRNRYHLLMRVYHPDLAGEEKGWLTERAERINRAYRRTRAEASRAQPGASPASSSIRRRSERRDRARLRRRVRRRLGTPRALRLRVLLGVALACTAFVVHTCVAHRAWQGSGSERGPAPPHEQVLLSFEGLRP